MRTGFLDVIDSTDDDTLLTTGEAAKILGVTRQRVVDLCNAGDLPYTTIGKHRRISRADVEAFKLARQRMTPDQYRSLLLSFAVAGRLVANPEETLHQARINLNRLMQSSHRASAGIWLNEWDRLLSGPMQTLLTTLTSTSLRSRELRQNTPFAGVLTEDERMAVLRTARRKKWAAT